MFYSFVVPSLDGGLIADGLKIERLKCFILSRDRDLCTKYHAMYIPITNKIFSLQFLAIQCLKSDGY